MFSWLRVIRRLILYGGRCLICGRSVLVRLAVRLSRRGRYVRWLVRLGLRSSCRRLRVW